MPYLIVEKGEPYEKNKFILLSNKVITIGRLSEESQADIVFTNPYISREHFCIEYVNDQYKIIDKNSKNGIKLNNKDLEKNKYFKINNGDRISLANNEVILLYYEDNIISTMTSPTANDQIEIIFKDDRREIKINNKLVELTGNLYELFKILYNNHGKGVSHDEIRKAVWPDRTADYNGIPFVSEEEIMTNIMRLRKKLQDYPDLIKTLRGFGYMLDHG